MSNVGGVYIHTDKNEYELISVLLNPPNGEGVMAFLASAINREAHRLELSNVVGIAAALFAAPGMMYYDGTHGDWDRFPVPSKVDLPED